MDEFQDKYKRYTNIAKYGGLGVAAIVVVPLLFTVSFAVLSTMAVASAAIISAFVTAALGMAFVNFLPVMAMKFANWKLKGLKAEARANPIETAQNQLLDWSRNLDDYKDETAERIAQYNALREETIEVAKTDPEGAATFQSRLDSFEQEIKDREENIRTMVDQLDEATAKVQKAAKLWKLEQQFVKSLSPTEAKASLDRIVLNEALDEVMRVTQNTASRMRVDAIVSSQKRAIKEAKQIAK